MSRAVYWAARQHPPRPLDKLLLIALADHAHKESGEIFPSVAALCAWTGCDRKTVMKATASLEASGLLVDTHQRRGKTGQVKVYRLPLEAVPETAPFDEVVPETGPLKSTTFPIEESQKRDTEPPIKPPSTKTSSSPKRDVRKLSKGSRIAIDWHPRPLPDAVSKLVAGWPPGRLEIVTDEFRDFWLTATRGAEKTDWDRTFHNRLRDRHLHFERQDTRNGLSQRNNHAAPGDGARADRMGGPRRGFATDMLTAALARPDEGSPGDPSDDWGIESPLSAHLRRRS